MKKFLIAALIFLNPFIRGYAQAPKITADIETGIVRSGYNNIRIPGDTGTKISLSKDFKAHPTSFVRLRLQSHFSEQHQVSLLLAPLLIHSDGQVNKEIHFEGKTFPANTKLKALYKFNSYRLTYSYNMYRGKKPDFYLGITAKIINASIKIISNTIKTERSNHEFVHLITFN